MLNRKQLTQAFNNFNKDLLVGTDLVLLQECIEQDGMSKKKLNKKLDYLINQAIHAAKHEKEFRQFDYICMKLAREVKKLPADSDDFEDITNFAAGDIAEALGYHIDQGVACFYGDWSIIEWFQDTRAAYHYAQGLMDFKKNID